MAETINIEVAFALPTRQKLLELQVPVGTTARQAVRLSNIASYFPDLDVEGHPLGIFGNELGTRGMASAEDYSVREGDRIEIYRPLIADPKEVRRQRAEEAKLKRQKEAGQPSAGSAAGN